MLAGFSFGGLVAAQLAARRPQVRALALLGAAGHGGTRRPRGELRPWRAEQAATDPQGLRDTLRHNLQMHMLAAQCRQAHTHIVPAAGHWVPYEAAEAVNRLLASGLG